MWVFDSASLVYLAQAGAASDLSRLDERCVIPDAVFQEVVEVGVDRGVPAARRAERAVENGVVDVGEVTDSEFMRRLQRITNATEADIEVLAVARESDGVAVTDAPYMRSIADVEDVGARSVAYVLLLLAGQGAISLETTRKAIDDMLDAGWQCPPDAYARILRTLDSFAL